MLAISNKAAKAIQQKSRDWNWRLQSGSDLEALAMKYNPVIQGWLNYYGHFYPSALIPTLYCLEDRLVKWAMRKYKHLRGHRRRAAQWLKGIAQKEPELLAHWRLIYATAG